MASTLPKEAIRMILEHDRIWAAYALADLDPEHDEFAEWYVEDDAVLLCYAGLDPPILFATGTGDTVMRLCRNLYPQEYQFSFPVDVLERMTGKNKIERQISMLRMNRVGRAPDTNPDIESRRLTDLDCTAIEHLYRGHRDAPDGFHPRQLDQGPFFGVWQSDALVATAGVHVLSKASNVAAIGNVFTHPAVRKKGLARACSQSVLHTLDEMSIGIIVLNVARANRAAIRLYESLGFAIHCSFYEGSIILSDFL